MSIIIQIIFAGIVLVDGVSGNDQTISGQVNFNMPGLEFKLISQDEISRMESINGKYWSVCYDQELEKKEQEISQLLEQRGSLILAATGLEELVRFNIVLPNQTAMLYSNLHYTICITSDDSIFLFLVFHEQLELTLHSQLNIYHEPNNRFIGDSLANFYMWIIMQQHWPEAFYKYSQDISDIFSLSEQLYD